MIKKSSTKNRIVHVGLTQMSCSADVKANRAKQVRLVEQAAKQGADIVCTQELFASQYFCQVEDHRFFKLAETIPGPSTVALGKVAKKYKVTIIASLFEKRADGLYHNTAAVIDADGKIQGVYRKMHIPDDPLYYEKFYFTPGDTGFRAWDTKQGKVGVLICWDQWFPEAARLTVNSGRANFILSHRDRLASIGKKTVRESAARSMGINPTLARGGERLLRGRAESDRRGKNHRRGWETRERRGDRILGTKFYRRPERRDRREGIGG